MDIGSYNFYFIQIETFHTVTTTCHSLKSIIWINSSPYSITIST